MSPYFATIFNKDSDFFLVPWNGYAVDYIAGILVICCSGFITLSTHGSSWANVVVTGTQVLVMTLIVIMGFIKADHQNLPAFFPFGARGVFDAAGFVFFNYIGFDAVSTLAEEVKSPRRDLPRGLLWGLGLVVLCYVLMGFNLGSMVPYQSVDPILGFTAAFTYQGFKWAQYIIALSACLSAMTGVLIGSLAVARYVAAVGRSHMVFPFLSYIHPRFQTPAAATGLLMVVTLPIAVLVDLSTLRSLTSVGTLVVYAVVALGLMWNRYHIKERGRQGVIKPAVFLGLLVVMCIIMGACYAANIPWYGYVIIIGIHLAITAGMQWMVPQVSMT